ncbi:MAG: ferrous iron transport protein A [Clostridiales bacterium]|nr:ferrous iron transport protein A [Clostridiales bacterium]
MPVMLMGAGDEAVIRRISGHPAIRQRLAELGFVSGARVQAVGTSPGGIILLVKGSRVALGADMARHIFV